MIRQRTKTILLSAVSGLALVMLLYPGTVFAAANPLEEHAAFTEDLVKSASWQEGKGDLDKMYARIKALNDYIFESNLTACKNNSISRNNGRFFFKKQSRLRVEVLSGSRNKGAIVVKQENGNIRGCGGGALKFIKMNLEKDSRMLMLPNGLNVVESDFATLISHLKARVNHGASVKITSQTLTPYKWCGPVKIIEARQGNVLTDRILISTGMNIPVEWDIYQGGKLASIAVFKNFKPNAGLEDNLFEL